MSARGDTARSFSGRLEAAVATVLENQPIPAADSATRRRAVPSGSDRVAVSAHLTTQECPAGALAPGEEFRETARTAARALALEALSERSAGAGRGHRSAELSPTEALEAVIGDATRFRPDLERLLVQGDRASLAAVRAAATSWMVDALALGERRSAPQWQSPRNRSHALGQPRVTLTAGVDAVRVIGSEVHLLVVRVRPGSTDRRLAGRVALLWALDAGEVPASVTLAHRETMQIERHDIDDAAMEDAVRRAAQEIGWALLPSSAPFVPGAQCRYCEKFDECGDGRTHMATRVGVPFPTTGVQDVRAGAGGSGPQPGSRGEPTM